jgi:hypothetical protein
MKKLKTILNILPYGIIVGVTAGILTFGLPHEQVVVTKEKQVDFSLEQKVSELQSELLDDLKRAEVGGYENMDVIIVFDPLRKDLNKCRQVGGVRLHCYSFGVYNFKIDTVKYFYEKYYYETLTDLEALELALDPERSRDLAHTIIFSEDKGGIFHWTNSAKKIDAKRRIGFIRDLMK